MTTDDANWARYRYDYNEATGEFLWRNPPNKGPRNKMHIGKPAGTVNPSDDMLMLRLGKKMHSAARVAWLYVNGEWPDRQVHYLDAALPLPTRNRFSNLRLVGRAVAELTVEKVRALLDYDPETGVFTWRVKRRGVRLGERAGTVKSVGEGRVPHCYIRIDQVDYAAQRLAWLHVHGDWPATRIVFDNGDPTDCRIANLRVGEFEHGTRQNPEVAPEVLIARRARKYRKHDLLRDFGLTEADYQAKLDAQDACCAICRKPERVTRNGKPRNLSIDHDHKTGAIRELLCNNCNALLGLVNDDIGLLAAAIAYLSKHQLSPLPRKESA